jgi:hypothetical protein
MNWRKATYSGDSGGNCVEVASASGRIMIRDTKDRRHGPLLQIASQDWMRFTSSLRQEFPRT